MTGVEDLVARMAEVNALPEDDPSLHEPNPFHENVSGLETTDAAVERLRGITHREALEAEIPPTHDLLAEPIKGSYDGVFALDVLEHIAPSDEHVFLKNGFSPLTTHGVAIIGMPSLESQVYASPTSRAGHVNCKTMPDLKATMQRYFHNVFMFSMNDEVVYTGYHKTAHYLFALGCSKK